MLIYYPFGNCDLSFIRSTFHVLNVLFRFRQSVLQAAEHLYRFQTDVSSLSSWMKKVLDKLNSTAEPRNLKETKTLLKYHQEIQSEMKVREEVFERVKKYGGVLVTEGGLPADEVEPKLLQLEKEKAQLEELWQRKHVSLNQSHDLQVFELKSLIFLQPMFMQDIK